MKRILPLLGGLLLAVTALTARNRISTPADKGRVIGENVTYVVPDDGRSLEAIAAEYGIGLLAMLEANPGRIRICRNPQRTDYPVTTDPAGYPASGYCD